MSCADLINAPGRPARAGVPGRQARCVPPLAPRRARLPPLRQGPRRPGPLRRRRHRRPRASSRRRGVGLSRPLLLFLIANRASNDESSCQHFACIAGMQEAHDDGMKASSLTDAGLVHLVEGCKQLEKLTLNWCFSIGLVGMANSCQNLRSLELLGGNVQNDGLIALAEGCNLNDLKLCGVQKLTDEGLVEYVKILWEILGVPYRFFLWKLYDR